MQHQLFLQSIHIVSDQNRIKRDLYRSCVDSADKNRYRWIRDSVVVPLG